MRERRQGMMVARFKLSIFTRAHAKSMLQGVWIVRLAIRSVWW
jgi:hypothetical protein